MMQLHSLFVWRKGKEGEWKEGIGGYSTSANNGVELTTTMDAQGVCLLPLEDQNYRAKDTKKWEDSESTYGYQTIPQHCCKKIDKK